MMNADDDILKERYSYGDCFNYITQTIDDTIFKSMLNKNLTKMTNAFSICEETWDSFMFLAINIQRFFTHAPQNLRSADFYIKLSKIVLRSIFTVSVSIVSREYIDANGDIVCNKGKFEEWLDLPQFSDEDKLKRLYCWLVEFLNCPTSYETLYTKRY